MSLHRLRLATAERATHGSRGSRPRHCSCLHRRFRLPAPSDDSPTAPRSSQLARDRAVLQRSLLSFVGADGYDVDCLRADLARFVFLLGGDAEPLFGAESR